MKQASDNIGFLGADDVRHFEDLLHRLMDATRADCVLLLDRAGRLLAQAGDQIGLDETAFASLASAGFAASGQLAALLGEQEFSSLYHHGLDRSMFLADVGSVAILAVLFDTRTLLGMVRIRTRSIVPQFVQALDRIAQRGPTGPLIQMEADWAAEAESQIDRLFSD